MRFSISPRSMRRASWSCSTARRSSSGFGVVGGWCTFSVFMAGRLLPPLLGPALLPREYLRKALLARRASGVSERGGRTREAGVDLRVEGVVAVRHQQVIPRRSPLLPLHEVARQ